MVESSTCRNSAAFIILSRLGAKKKSLPEEIPVISENYEFGSVFELENNE